mmetsp:Transcript_111729/g.355437  ORF Transcript_111729/g.355437 Transcript_111729/m.355437 type:complete len:229 (+) Transcript_111729:135-821(+)
MFARTPPRALSPSGLTAARGQLEDLAPESAQPGPVCVRSLEVVDAVVVALASAIVHPISGAVLLRIFVQHALELGVLTDGNGGVTNVGHTVDVPLCVRTLEQRVLRQVLPQVDALRQRRGQNCVPSPIHQEARHEAEAHVLQHFHRAIREDDLRQPRWAVDPSPRHVPIHAERVEHVECSFGEAHQTNLFRRDLAAQLAVGITPDIIQCAQHVQGVGVPPLVDMRLGP